MAMHEHPVRLDETERKDGEPKLRFCPEILEENLRIIALLSVFLDCF